MAINHRKKRYKASSRRRTVRSANQANVRRKRKNPYQSVEDPQQSKSRKIQFLLIFAALIGMTYMLLYHSFFRIEHIEVHGTSRIKPNELSNAVQGIMDYRMWFVFPGNNYYLVDTQEISEILLERYPIQSVNISVSFPDTLTIDIEEKISTVIYDDGDMYTYLDISGTKIEPIRRVGEDEWQTIEKTPKSSTAIIATQATTSTQAEALSLLPATTTPKETIRTHTPAVAQLRAEVGEYPIIYHIRNDKELFDTSGEANVVLPPDVMAGIVLWYVELKKAGIPFSYIEVEEPLTSQGTIYTDEGWKLHVLHTDVEAQLERLQYVLTEHITRPHIEYIDVRYENRVYWK